MYKFHYDYSKNKYSNNSILLFTDSDDFMYETKTADIYEDFSQDKQMFNFSNYFDNSNKLVVGTNQWLIRLKENIWFCY